MVSDPVSDTEAWSDNNKITHRLYHCLCILSDHKLLLIYCSYCHLCIYRFEKESSSIKGWLNRCESVCCPDTDLLSADKVKLRNELLNIKVSNFTILHLVLTNLYICI